MTFPENLLYTAEHEWVRVEGNVAYIGITDHAQSELGDIVYVDINTLGQAVKSGDVFGTVEAVKTVSDLYMPIDGTVDELNSKLNDQPELVNKDPYGDGWMIKVTITGEVNNGHTLSAAQYRENIGR